MIPFTACTTAETSNVFQWARQLPKIAPSHGDLDSHLIHGFLNPPSQPPNSVSIGSAVFAGHIVWLTDRQTTLHATSVAIGHICAVHTMRPKINHQTSSLLELSSVSWENSCSILYTTSKRKLQNSGTMCQQQRECYLALRRFLVHRGLAELQVYQSLAAGLTTLSHKQQQQQTTTS